MFRGKHKTWNKFVGERRSSKGIRLTRSPIVNKAVSIIVEDFDPIGVVIYGPTAMGYVDDARVSMLVLVKDDISPLGACIAMTEDLALNFIDGDVTAVTRSLLKENAERCETKTYNALQTGVLVYGVLL